MRELIYKGGTVEQSFGIVGTPTNQTYEDGSFLCVGDIVKTTGVEELSVVVMDGDKKHNTFVMGFKGREVTDGILIPYDVKTTLVRKHYHTSESDYPIRSIHMKTIAEPKQPKSKLSQITVPVKVDVQPVNKPKQSSPRPIIEEDDSETYIFVGNTVVYLNKECGLYGVSTCGSKDIYNKEIGKALAFYRASHSEK